MIITANIIAPKSATKTYFKGEKMEIDWKQVDYKNIAVVGGIRTGKTALAMKIISESELDKFVYKHPKPEIIEPFGFKSIDFGDLDYIQDCIFFIDEPQLYVKLDDKKGNMVLKRLLSICGQRNIKLVICTSDTRFIVRSLESYIDCWCIKDIDYDMIKQGSRIKKIIQDYAFVSTEGFKLKINEYIFYQRSSRFNRKWTFEKPPWFTEELSKPYKME